MSGRPSALPGRGALPPALLLLALASVFAFGHDRSHFYRAEHHDWLTVRTLTVAGHFSPEHRFLGFVRQKLGEDGEREYVGLYNRFPAGVYALVRLATLAAGDDLARQVLAARLLMLACYAGAAVLAYLSLARLTGRRWIALAATLLACCPYYLLYYNDMVASEIPSLFGVMLTFHGMTLFVQEGRFRQLLPRTAAALLLGWHAAALVAPFVLIGLGGEFLRARPEGRGLRGAAPALAALARSRYLAYGAAAALWCALVLGFNLGNEYLALGGDAPPHELPTFRSLLGRAGNDPEHFGPVGWLPFLRGQFAGIGGMAIPFAAADLSGLGLAQPRYGLWPPPPAAPWLAALGAAVFAACLAGLRRMPQRALAATLLLAGWCWAIPFRGSAALHEFEAIFHLGAALLFWSLVLLGLRRALPPGRAARALPAIALAALAAFALSAALMARTGHDAEAARRQRETAADFTAIRPLARGRSVVADLIDHALITRQHRRNYWLAGSYTQIEPIGSAREWRELPAYDFVVLPADLGGSLTPDNRRFFLYRLADLPRIRAAIAAREPAARAAFDVRRDGRTLSWVRDPCSGEDAAPRFFLHVTPADAGDLPAGRRASGFEGLDFWFRDRGVRFGGTCMATAALPDYPVARIRTGQHEGGAELWEAELALPAAE